MASDRRPTMPPALPELRHDLPRIEWEERRAARELTDAIDGCPEAREALRRWESVRERRMVVEARIAELEARHG